MYHAVQDDWQSPLVVTSAEFEAHCAWLQKHGRVLTIEAWLRQFRSETREPPFTAITFDDAFASVYDVAFPILRRYGLPATVFVVGGTLHSQPRAVDWTNGTPPGGLEVLRPEQIREMSASGVTFGSHGQTHRDLTSMSLTECQRELLDSRSALGEVLSTRPTLLAYPLGKHNVEVRRAVRHAGYSYAFGTARGNDPVGPYAIPRAGVYPGDRSAALRLKVSRWYLPVRRGHLYPILRWVVRRS